MSQLAIPGETDLRTEATNRLAAITVAGGEPRVPASPRQDMLDGRAVVADRGSGTSVSLAEAVSGMLAILEAGTDGLVGLLQLAELDPDLAGMDAAQVTGALTRADRVVRRLTSSRLRVLRIGEQVQAGRRAGFTDTGSWFAQATQTNRRDAASQTDLANRLRPVPAQARGDAAADDPTPDVQTAPAHQGIGAGPDAASGDGAKTGAGRCELRESLTQRALDAGEVSLGHAAIITHALAGLPTGLSPDQVTSVEQHLLRQARQVDPTTLRKLARRAIEAVEPDPVVVDANENAQLQDEHDAAYRASSFWMKDNTDGTTTGGFTVPWASGTALRTVLDAMTAPRTITKGARSGGGVSPHGTSSDPSPNSGLSTSSDPSPSSGLSTSSGPGTNSGLSTNSGPSPSSGLSTNSGPGTNSGPSIAQPTGTAGTSGDVALSPGGASGPAGGDLSWRDQQWDWAQRRGMALADLLLHLPTDHLPGRITATMLVHTDLATLRGDLERAARTSNGDKLSAATARRLACQAGLLPSVLGTSSVPLDLGRSTRLFTASQRAALSTRYDTCVVIGCDRPFAWTEVHHLRPWTSGGRTDLDDGVPACARHHQDFHHPDTTMTVHRDRTGRVSIALTRRRPSRT